VGHRFHHPREMVDIHGLRVVGAATPGWTWGSWSDGGSRSDSTIS
jgi:hypothetical protein